jgi:hypothetical protein
LTKLGCIRKFRPKRFHKIDRRTFRLSFSGSLTDFAHTFSIAETAAESEDQLAEEGEDGKAASSKTNGKAEFLEKRIRLSKKGRTVRNFPIFFSLTAQFSLFV